jgi:hypothetical protein
MVSAIQARPRSRYSSMSRTDESASTTTKFCDASKRLTSARLSTLWSSSTTTIGTLRTSVVAA